MRQEELVGKIQTVTGLITPDSLGVTLTHEHFFTDLKFYFIEPKEATQKKRAYERVSIENLYWVKPRIFTNLDNLTMIDEQVAIKEALLYKLAGGNSIVDVTPEGVSRDPQALQRISRATGLNIIMGSGYYLSSAHPPELRSKTEEEIAEGIIRDIMVGVGNTGVRAGIIGEIGCGWAGIEATERKVLRASAIAQQHTGAAINVHPCMPPLSGEENMLEAIQILENCGADLSRTVISHIDCFEFSHSLRRKIADKGCLLEYDGFGHSELPPLAGRYIDIPTDLQRVKQIIELVTDGHINQILLSHDTAFKQCLTTYGGHGYAHVLEHIVPMMGGQGMSDEQIHTLLVENPKWILTFVRAEK